MSLKNKMSADDPEFRCLLDRFGKERLAKAEERGRAKAVRDVLKIILKARMPGTTKEWLMDQCRNLTTPPQ